MISNINIATLCTTTTTTATSTDDLILQRPTPPHLTSVMAEQMLARACENESENAKRMKLGLEPVSQSLPSQLVSHSHSLESVANQYKAEQLVSLLAQSGAAASNGVRHHHSSSSSSASPFPGLSNTNGRDLSETGAGLGKKTPLLTHKLNGTEITAVRQLITGKHNRTTPNYN